MRMRENWTEVRDPHHLAPYIYRDRQWVGYDDVESIKVKAEFIKAMRLAGGMIWSVETDDFIGKCHGEKYPLLKTINRVFQRDVSGVPLPASTSSTSSSSSTESVSSTTQKPVSTTKSWTWDGPTSKATSVSAETSTSKSTIISTEHSISSSTITSSKTPWPWAPTHSWGSSGSASPSSTTTVSTTSSSSSSSSSTSSDGDNNVPGSNEFVCREEGMQRHRHNCQKFFHCVQSTLQGVYRVYEYNCPDGTVFDLVTKSCTWPHNVPECSKKVKVERIQLKNE